MDALAKILLAGDDDTDTPTRARQATVTSTSPVEVNLAGASDVPAATCSGYTPVVDDVVLCIQLGTDLIIIDQIVSGG